MQKKFRENNKNELDAAFSKEFKPNKKIKQLQAKIQAEIEKIGNIEKVLNGESLKKAKIILEETKKKYSYLCNRIAELEEEQQEEPPCKLPLRLTLSPLEI